MGTNMLMKSVYQIESISTNAGFNMFQNASQHKLRNELKFLNNNIFLLFISYVLPNFVTDNNIRTNILFKAFIYLLRSRNNNIFFFICFGL